MTSPTDKGREEFFRTVRAALGRSPGAGLVPEHTARAEAMSDVEARAATARARAEDAAESLFVELEESAVQAGWTVVRSESDEDAARYIGEVARDLEARSIVRSAHAVLKRLEVDAWLSKAGVRLTVMATEDRAEEKAREEQRRSFRETAIEADLGVTGVDYAIAETGSCVLLAGKGVSRLVSLLPPVHVAVVERGQVLPSLDELFTLQRLDHLQGKGGSYMNMISGPSRSADIEQTIVKGVHGPGETHMVLLG